MLINVPGSSTGHDSIVEKTRELCGAIVLHPSFARMQARIQAFVNDPNVQRKYAEVNDRGERLHHLQAQGLPLDPGEVTEFQKLRENLLRDPIAAGFLEAQEEMQKIQRSIQEQVALTFELGRVPAAEDLSGGSCGSGCGCHH